MFQFFKDTNYDFMGKRYLIVGFSALLVVLSIVVVAVRGINLGIEFTGGTELQIKYAGTPDLHAVRDALGRAGFPNHVVTTIGDPKENEVYIRIGLAQNGQKEGEVAPKVLAALRAASGSAEGKLDLNQTDEPTLRSALAGVGGLTADDADKLATTITAKRKTIAIFRSFDDLKTLEGMRPEVLDALRQSATLGTFSLRGQSYIGPAVGSELIRQALWAIGGSLAGMLIYLGIRFQFQWGVAAVIALVHDTIITLGLFCLFGKEMSLPVVAAFLTLVGYSVNDTVVIFDRIRENLGRGATEDFPTVINTAINQTLSRTIITSGLTWITVLSMFFLGGEALHPFAFVLTIGIVIGTYSTIYIASPYLVIVRAYVLRREKKGAVANAPAPKAKKVRSASKG